MIGMSQIEAYRVGEKEYPVEGGPLNVAGQAYNTAWREAQATGQPILVVEKEEGE